MEKVELLEVEVCCEVREQWLGGLTPSYIAKLVIS